MIASRNSPARLLPFELLIRGGGVSRIVFVEKLPSFGLGVPGGLRGGGKRRALRDLGADVLGEPLEIVPLR